MKGPRRTVPGRAGGWGARGEPRACVCVRGSPAGAAALSLAGHRRRTGGDVLYPVSHPNRQIRKRRFSHVGGCGWGGVSEGLVPVAGQRGGWEGERRAGERGKEAESKRDRHREKDREKEQGRE